MRDGADVRYQDCLRKRAIRPAGGFNIGFMPAMGATVRIPRFLPGAVAAEMLLTGNRINAGKLYGSVWSAGLC